MKKNFNATKAESILYFLVNDLVQAKMDLFCGMIQFFSIVKGCISLKTIEKRKMDYLNYEVQLFQAINLYEKLKKSPDVRTIRYYRKHPKNGSVAILTELYLHFTSEEDNFYETLNGLIDSCFTRRFVDKHFELGRDILKAPSIANNQAAALVSQLGEFKQYLDKKSGVPVEGFLDYDYLYSKVTRMLQATEAINNKYPSEGLFKRSYREIKLPVESSQSPKTKSDQAQEELKTNTEPKSDYAQGELKLKHKVSQNLNSVKTSEESASRPDSTVKDQRLISSLRKNLCESPDGVKQIYDAIVKDDNPYSIYYGKDLVNNIFFYKRIFFDVKLMEEIYDRFQRDFDELSGIEPGNKLAIDSEKTVETNDQKYSRIERQCKALVEILLSHGIPADEFPPILKDTYQEYFG